jgi:flagellar M-ring protein FliF
LKNKNIHVEKTGNLKQINTTYKKDFIKNCLGLFLMLWGKLTSIQKICFVVIAIAFIGGIIALLTVPTVPTVSTMVPVIDMPIHDEVVLNRIVQRINQEGIKTSISSNGLILIPDENTVRRMRGILIREDLIPSGIAPWAIFDMDRQTLTDFERNVNFQRAGDG